MEEGTSLMCLVIELAPKVSSSSRSTNPRPAIAYMVSAEKSVDDVSSRQTQTCQTNTYLDQRPLVNQLELLHSHNGDVLFSSSLLVLSEASVSASTVATGPI